MGSPSIGQNPYANIQQGIQTQGQQIKQAAAQLLTAARKGTGLGQVLKDLEVRTNSIAVGLKQAKQGAVNGLSSKQVKIYKSVKSDVQQLNRQVRDLRVQVGNVHSDIRAGRAKLEKMYKNVEKYANAGNLGKAQAELQKMAKLQQSLKGKIAVLKGKGLEKQQQIQKTGDIGLGHFGMALDTKNMKDRLGNIEKRLEKYSMPMLVKVMPKQMREFVELEKAIKGMHEKWSPANLKKNHVSEADIEKVKNLNKRLEALEKEIEYHQKAGLIKTTTESIVEWFGRLLS